MMPGTGLIKGALTTYTLDTDFAWAAGDKSMFIRFISPITQSSGALTYYAYLDSVGSGDTPDTTSVICGLSGVDDDLPDSTPIATSGELSLSGSDDATWLTFAFTGVSLTAGGSYFLIIYNSSASPTVDTFSMPYRCIVDVMGGEVNPTWEGYDTAGYTGSVPTYIQSTMQPPFVVKFADGTLYGNPYVNTVSVSGNNSPKTDKGIRVNFSEDVVLSGFQWRDVSAHYVNCEIHQGASGTPVATDVLDENQQLNQSVARFVPQTLTGGTDYDIVLTYGASTTSGACIDMGEVEGNLPADVIACRPTWLKGLVTGDPTTPYTLDTSRAMHCRLIIDDNPAIAGGSGGIAKLAGEGGGLVG